MPWCEDVRSRLRKGVGWEEGAEMPSVCLAAGEELQEAGENVREGSWLRWRWV